MESIICHSTDISLRRVNEQLSCGKDMILVPVEVLVCNNCAAALAFLHNLCYHYPIERV